jgi:hypothetical protein
MVTMRTSVVGETPIAQYRFSRSDLASTRKYQSKRNARLYIYIYIYYMAPRTPIRGYQRLGGRHASTENGGSMSYETFVPTH